MEQTNMQGGLRGKVLPQVSFREEQGEKRASLSIRVLSRRHLGQPLISQSWKGLYSLTAWDLT